MNRHYLSEVLRNNCVTLAFNRRTEPIGDIRRMVCTRAKGILDTNNGRRYLKYHPPGRMHPMYFSPKQKNLLVVWDLFLQDYRLIPCESVSILERVPTMAFWPYYRDKLMPMTKQQKIEFMYSS